MFSFFNILILLGTLQGFIVSAILFFTKQNKLTNRLLAVFILLISLSCFNLYAITNDWFEYSLLRVVSNFIPLVIIMPLGPLLYFFVQSLLNSEFELGKKERRHFYTVIVDFIPSITVILFYIGINTKLIDNNPASWGLFLDSYNVYADIPRWLSLAYYTWLSYQYIKQHRSAGSKGSNSQPGGIKWVQQLVVAIALFVSLWFIYLIPYCIPHFSDWLLRKLYWYPIYLPMVVLIYWMGIKILLLQAGIKSKSSPTSALSKEVIEKTIAQLVQAMESDKLFLKPELSLSALSNKVSIPQKTISSVLNQHMQKNFNEFVNEYRLRAFKEKVNLSGTQHLTIAGIAAECGFSSQATFQRIFKEVEGVSPSVYVKQVQNAD